MTYTHKEANNEAEEKVSSVFDIFKNKNVKMCGYIHSEYVGVQNRMMAALCCGNTLI